MPTGFVFLPYDGVSCGFCADFLCYLCARETGDNEEGMKMMKSRFEDYTHDDVLIPDRPDIDRIIVIPLHVIFYNLSAEPGANVTQLVHDLDAPLGYSLRFPSRF